MKLCRVRDKPDVHAVVLGEALHLAEQLRDVFRLGHVGRPAVLDLVVGVDNEAPDTVAGNGGARLVENCLDRGRLVIEADQVKMVGNPTLDRAEKVGLRHAACRTIPERQPEIFLGELGDMFLGRVLETA